MIKGYVARFERHVETVTGTYKNANKFDGMARYYQEDIESYTCAYEVYGIQAETLAEAETKLKKFCEDSEDVREFLGVVIDNTIPDTEVKVEIDLFDNTGDLNEFDDIDYRKDPDSFKVSLEEAIKWLG